MYRHIATSSTTAPSIQLIHKNPEDEHPRESNRGLNQKKGWGHGVGKRCFNQEAINCSEVVINFHSSSWVVQQDASDTVNNETDLKRDSLKMLGSNLHPSSNGRREMNEAI